MSFFLSNVIDECARVCLMRPYSVCPVVYQRTGENQSSPDWQVTLDLVLEHIMNGTDEELGVELRKKSFHWIVN